MPPVKQIFNTDQLPVVTTLGSPGDDQHVPTEAAVRSAIVGATGIEEAPVDGILYARKDAGWATISSVESKLYAYSNFI